MKRETILIKQCHTEYVNKFLQVREIYKQCPNDLITQRLMGKWSCLVDLMTRLHNSVLAQQRRKRNETDRPN